MQFTSKELKINVLAGVVSSILILYFIEPILSFFARAFIKISNSIASSFVDRLYQESTVGSTDSELLGLILFSLILMILIIHSLIKRLFKLYNNKLEYRVDVLLIAVTGLLLLFGVIIFYIKSKTKSSFYQKVDVVAPYIDEKDKLKIVSRFRLIKTQTDYFKLIAEIDSIANKANVVLPLNKSYPF